jgi:hypothetical protein
MDFVNWIRNEWDRVLAWVAVAAGALALLLGWQGVTGTPYAFEQIPYVISGGLGGIFILGVGAMLWISADLRDEWRKLAELGDLQRRMLDELTAGGDRPFLSVRPKSSGYDDAAARVVRSR